MKYMLLLASCLAAAAAAADDAVGWMRVSVPSNDVVGVLLPFYPLSAPSVGALLSGPFLGDGGEDSDRLVVVGAADGSRTSLVYSADGWLDEATCDAPTASPSPGDALLLDPFGREPFDFYLTGRFQMPGTGQNAYPQFAGIFVDWTNSAAHLVVETGGGPTDMLSADNAGLADAPAEWRHAGRFAGAAQPLVWQDAMSPGLATNRLYMVADAMRDADRDGIPDAVERCVYGTSPLLADTDGDGVRDGLEVAWGTDPLVAEFGTDWRFFEPFEHPGVGLGELNGQHGWRVSDPAAAVVQTRTAHAGRAALRISSDGEDCASVFVGRSVTNADGVVWVDSYCVATATRGPQDGNGAVMGVSMFFSDGGHPVMLDDTAFRTNESAAVALGEWVRCTFRLDYPARAWDFYVDGVIVGKGLGMGETTGGFKGIVAQGDGEAFIDDLVISASRPLGLSSDGDALPDEWEFRHFGSLDRDGSGDADGDGLSDLEELRHRTNPLIADTDGDGLSDAVEVNFYGTSPLSADTDGDGVPDMREIADGADPLSSCADSPAAFVESFELPDVGLGELDGQNGWSVSRRNAAVVQESVVRTGAAALKVVGDEDGGTVVLSHPVANAGGAVWVDIYSVARAAAPDAVVEADGMCFDGEGHPVVYAGGTFTTNRRIRVCMGGWVRTTMRLDYTNRTWDVYAAGILAERGLPMSPKLGGSFTGIGCAGDGEAQIDDIVVSHSRPQGLSSDGDALPDEWELRHFGTLERSGSGDADRDGVRDVDEFKAGTDPNLADTDGDGLPDRWEVRCGTDPNDPDDAHADPDGDGMDNAAEHRLGLDPLRPDADPRVPPEIAIRTDRQWYLAGQTVSVSATASDSDGTVKELAVYLDGRMLVHAFGGQASAQYVAAEIGTNAVEAVAADDSGKSAVAMVEIPVFDADADDDGDGLANAEEQSMGTNPLSPDTDGDGMPDKWEFLRGTNPAVADASADPDGDGLYNIEEFQHGTNPHLADTDGDGVGDGEECTALFSNPLAVDFDGTVATNAVIPASAVDVARGTWYVVGDALAIGERAGAVCFTNDLIMASHGVRQLRMEVRFSGTFDAELVCRVDGRMVGAVLLHSSPEVHAESARFTTFWLAEGLHGLEFELQNFGNGAVFFIDGIAVCEPCGRDDDGNGTPDWLDSRLSNSRALRGNVVESFVSPFCLRGVAGRPDMVELSGGHAVSSLPGFGWCADVPLDPTNATEVGISYENGMKGETVAVQWTPFDVMGRSDVALRRGDSLLFAADGTTIALDGNMLSDGLGGLHAHCFGEAGDFSLVACSGARTNVVAVHVVAVEAADAMPVWRGKANSLPFASPDMGGLSVAVDRGASVDSVGGSGESRVCGISVSALGRPSSLAFGIPNPDASVVKSVELQPFAAHYTIEGRYYVVATTRDGSHIVENRISAFGLPASAVLRMTSSSGITFADGSGSLELTAEDFDEIGDLSYQFVVPPGVGHPCQFLRLVFNRKVVAR